MQNQLSQFVTFLGCHHRLGLIGSNCYEKLPMTHTGLCTTGSQRKLNATVNYWEGHEQVGEALSRTHNVQLLPFLNCTKNSVGQNWGLLVSCSYIAVKDLEWARRHCTEEEINIKKKSCRQPLSSRLKQLLILKKSKQICHIHTQDCIAGRKQGKG